MITFRINWLPSLSRIATLALLAGCASTPHDSITDPLTQGAYDQILKETMWIGDAVYGPNGEIENRTATAVRVLLGHDQADKIYLQLIKNAEPAGKLYALCGLYYANREQFQKEIEAFRNDSREIPSTSADVVGVRKMCDIVFCPVQETTKKRIVLGKGQTLRQWVKENKDTTGYCDISGGSYPDSIVHPYLGDD